MEHLKNELLTAFGTALEISVKREDVDRMMQVRQALQRAFALATKAEQELAAVTKERDDCLAQLGGQPEEAGHGG